MGFGLGLHVGQAIGQECDFKIEVFFGADRDLKLY